MGRQVPLAPRVGGAGGLRVVWDGSIRKSGAGSNAGSKFHSGWSMPEFGAAI